MYTPNAYVWLDWLGLRLRLWRRRCPGSCDAPGTLAARKTLAISDWINNNQTIAKPRSSNWNRLVPPAPPRAITSQRAQHPVRRESRSSERFAECQSISSRCIASSHRPLYCRRRGRRGRSCRRRRRKQLQRDETLLRSVKSLFCYNFKIKFELKSNQLQMPAWAGRGARKRNFWFACCA